VEQREGSGKNQHGYCRRVAQRYVYTYEAEVSTDSADWETDPEIVPIEAPLNANVWKVEVKEGDEIKSEQTVSILEAMKLEIPVKADESMAGGKVEKLLVKPNDVVQAGSPLMLLRKAKD